MGDNGGTEQRGMDREAPALARRRVLQGAAAAGVGAVAWSGASITSLGGTPAYAQGCTFVIDIDLSGGCRNTDQASGADFGYHTLKKDNLPTGYDILNNIPEGTACNAGHVSQFTFPAGITCIVRIQFNGPSQCTGTDRGLLEYGPESDGSIDIEFTCVTPSFPSNTQYTVTATCNTTGAPEECLNN